MPHQYYQEPQGHHNQVVAKTRKVSTTQVAFNSYRAKHSRKGSKISKVFLVGLPVMCYLLVTHQTPTDAIDAIVTMVKSRV